MCMGGTEHLQCSSDFKMCPLGIQFTTDRRVRPFDLFEFSLDLNEVGRHEKASAPAQCTGAVVKCRKQRGRDEYRVWIKFLEIPEGARDRIACVSKEGRHLCHNCENF